jgi:hypothetical protein
MCCFWYLDFLRVGHTGHEINLEGGVEKPYYRTAHKKNNRSPNRSNQVKNIFIRYKRCQDYFVQYSGLECINWTCVSRTDSSEMRERQ